MHTETAIPQSHDLSPIATGLTSASSSGMRLGPPFFSPWSFYRGPKPRGFTCDVSANSYHGTMRVTLAAAPHPPDSPQIIGYGFGHWQCQVYAPYAGARFEVATYPTSIRVAENGGVWRARCGIALKVGNRVIVEKISNMYQGQICRVYVQAPYRGYFTLTQGTSARAVYRASANPYGTVDSKVLYVDAPFGARTLSAAAATKAAEETAEALAADLEMPFGVEIEDPTAEELAEYAKLHERATVHQLGTSEEEQRVSGLKVFKE